MDARENRRGLLCASSEEKGKRVLPNARGLVARRASCESPGGWSEQGQERSRSQQPGDELGGTSRPATPIKTGLLESAKEYAIIGQVMFRQ